MSGSTAEILLWVAWIATIHNVALLVWHTYSYYTFQNIKEIKMLARLSLIAIFSTILYQLINAVSSTFETSIDFIMPCKLNVWGAAVTFAFSKLITYYLIMERLFTLFKKTPFKFGTCTRYTLRIMLLAIFVIETYLFIYFVEYKDAYTFNGDNDKYNEIVWCTHDYPPQILGLLPLLDVIICIIASIFFVRRLISFNIFLARDDGRINKENVSWRIATKSTFLTCIALLSTPLCLGLVTFIQHVTILISMDSIINCWCIMLMINTSNQIYDRVCLKFENKVITFKCLLYYSCNCKKLPQQENNVDDNNDNNDNNDNDNDNNDINDNDQAIEMPNVAARENEITVASNSESTVQQSLES